MGAEIYKIVEYLNCAASENEAISRLAEVRNQLEEKATAIAKAEKRLEEKATEIAEAEKKCQAAIIYKKNEEEVHYPDAEEKKRMNEIFVEIANELSKSYDDGYAQLKELRDIVIYNKYYAGVQKLAVITNKYEYINGKTNQYVRELSEVLKGFDAIPIDPAKGSVADSNVADAYIEVETQDGAFTWKDRFESCTPGAVIETVIARGWRLKDDPDAKPLVRATVIVDK